MTQFQPGKSGNLEGRPKGIKDKRTLFAEIIESHREELLNKALEMALDGNEIMLKMLLERILPAKPKDNAVCIELTGDTPTEKSKQVIEELNNQNITPADAMNIMQALVLQSRVFEVDEATKIIAELKTAIEQLKNK